MLRAVAASLGLALLVTLASGIRGQTTAGASLGDRIPLEGLAASNGGQALWNTGPDAVEPAQLGHPTPWTTCSTSAPYYLATRDYSDVDPTSTAGVRGLPSIAGLPGLVDALTTNGFSVTEITAGWTVQTLGDDVEGTDWVFDEATGVETRFYQGGSFGIRLNGEDLVGGSMAQTTLRIDYKDLANCSDDELSLQTDTVLPKNRSASSAQAAQAIATELLDDLAGHGLNFVFESVNATAETIAARGRTGGFFDATSGRAEVDAVCSCPIGISDADDTHDWTVFWPEATLPENGPVRIKVVAETLASTQETDPPPGVVTLTVFDESAPTVGTIFDVSFPSAKGANEGFLELNIQPQTQYTFTVRHTGAGRHYRLGASHAPLRLGQADQPYLPARSQDWAIETAAGETVTLELATDTNAEGSTQATFALVTIYDIENYDRVDGPTRLTFTPDSAQVVSFVNTGTDRRLMVQVEPDGEFRMKKVGGDERLYSLACPLRDGPTIPILTITDAGVTPQELNIAIGGRVFITNESSDGHELSSNPHPIHTNCPPLNEPGFLTPGGGGLTGVFDTAETCGFHDHLNPIDQTMRGQIHVGGSSSDGDGTDDGGGYDYFRRD